MIVVAPRIDGGVSLELHGDLAWILTLCSPNAKNPISGADGIFTLSGCGGRKPPIANLFTILFWPLADVWRVRFVALYPRISPICR